MFNAAEVFEYYAEPYRVIIIFLFHTKVQPIPDSRTVNRRGLLNMVYDIIIRWRRRNNDYEQRRIDSDWPSNSGSIYMSVYSMN